MKGQILYEMHIGTFTPEGTWAAAAEELPELAKIGISAVEMMPIGDFAGEFGWGYDGVDLFAPCRLYGEPDDLRGFINTAHSLGMSVILDVVYNHLGPEGNYLGVFSDDYTTDRYKTDWGAALNFDGPNSGPVREFFVSTRATGSRISISTASGSMPPRAFSMNRRSIFWPRSRARRGPKPARARSFLLPKTSRRKPG